MEEDEQRAGGYGLRQPSIVPGLLSQVSGSLPDELIRRLSVYDPVSDQSALSGSSVGGDLPLTPWVHMSHTTRLQTR